MRYELYADSLFLLNLCMNLYLLILVDRSTPGTAAPWRLLAGAVLGALCFLLSLAVKAPAPVRLLLGGLGGTAGMLCVAFRVRHFKMFLKLLECLCLYSFALGGGLLFLIGRFSFLREHLTGVSGILTAGGLFFLFFSGMRRGTDLRSCLCRAVLMREGRSVSVVGLIDSGNSLTEPISGKKVCVVDEGLYRELWSGCSEGCRVVPYHSIGRKHGYMLAYLLPKLRLDVDGMELELTDVYAAVSGEELSGARTPGGEPVRMIINPDLLRGEENPAQAAGSAAGTLSARLKKQERKRQL